MDVSACSLCLGEIKTLAKQKKKKKHTLQLSHKQLVGEFTDTAIRSGLFGHIKGHSYRKINISVQSIHFT